MERLDLDVVFFSDSVLAVDSEPGVSPGFAASPIGWDWVGSVGLAGAAGFVSSAFLEELSLESVVVAVSSDFDLDREERDLDDLFEVFSLGFSGSLVSEPAAAASPAVAGAVPVAGEPGVSVVDVDDEDACGVSDSVVAEVEG